MKKILLVVILAFIFLPITVKAQQWNEPYTERDGTQVEGHWDTPQDSWQKDYSKHGTLNPITGQRNTYERRKLPAASSPEKNTPGSNYLPGSKPDSAMNPYVRPGSTPDVDTNPYVMPGSKPDSAKNPYAIPGSKPDSASNPYAIPGSNPYSANSKLR